MKKEFELEYSDYPANAKISIIGKRPENKPYVSIVDVNGSAPLFIPDKDLERFAINILKALKSKRLSILKKGNR